MDFTILLVVGLVVFVREKRIRKRRDDGER